MLDIEKNGPSIPKSRPGSRRSEISIERRQERPERYEKPFEPRGRARKEIFPEMSRIMPDDKVLLEEVRGTGFRGGPVRRGKGYRLVAMSWAALTIDILLNLAACMILLAGTAAILHSPVRPILNDLRQGIFSGWFWTFIGVLGIYSVTLRMHLGCTLGEWACYLKLGDTQDRISSVYTMRVVLRCAIILCSGLIVIQILSLLTGRDLAGRLCGLHLMEKL